MTRARQGLSSQSIDIADHLFEAFQAGNIDALRTVCGDDMVACQNRGPSMNLDMQVVFCRFMHQVVDGFRYDEVRRQNTDLGFLSEHVICGRLQDGTEFRIPACVVGEVSNGLVTRTVEYMDTSAAAPLIRALGAMIPKQGTAR
jgi:ketosteroid isomerase-like protein